MLWNPSQLWRRSNVVVSDSEATVENLFIDWWTDENGGKTLLNTLFCVEHLELDPRPHRRNLTTNTDAPLW